MEMKKFILCALSFFCALTASAQDQTENPERKHLIGLQLGNAFVNGDFNASAFEDDYPAFARNGLLLTGVYRYSMSRYVAAGTSVAYRHNRFGMDAFVQPDDELVTAKNSEAWRSVFTMADVYFTVPVQEVGEVYLAGSAGAAFNRSASWQIQTVHGEVRMPSDQATALALGWGSGININVYPLVINAEARLLYTKPEFTVLNALGTPFQHSQSMNTFNISLGAFYRF
ncbi:outer membrane beta-barrel protein [uncultured Pontibacter sp.]|uniref:outer membrane beta-barrel protein n=1 Tax=uncultured Pontibacter sp. TaxID=453356 RepID=UPI002620AB25|nr:outer membrane beta-barrel protein [uncultured Pontibacter sp.]